MSSFFRFGSVLRARKAREDAARAAVVETRAEIRDAQALVKRRSLDLVGAEAPSEGSARSMVAALVARQSLAGALMSAQRMVEDAESVERDRLAVLADAAKRRRAVEMMAERHAELVRANELRKDQANLDELAMTSKARNSARGGGGAA